MKHGTRWSALLAAVIVGLVSCDYATDVEILEIQGTGVLFGQAYLDLNGTGASDAGDKPLKSASVEVTTGSGDVVLSATTDTLGVFVLLGVPVGTYDVGLGSGVLGDSLEQLGPGSSITVELGDTTQLSIGAGFPTMTLSEVRALAPGRRVFTHGIALNSRSASTDGTIHLLDTAEVSYLRTTNASLPATNVLTGDSLRILGRTALNNGLPVLDSATPYVLQRGLTLPPTPDVTTAAAATADAGALDAALVRIRAAEMSDTSTAPNGDFHFWANDGSDSVEVVFKWFRSFTPTAIRPDTTLRIREMIGLLTPFDDGTGSIRWRILPRGGSEVILEFKIVDLALTTAFTPTSATANDTVEIMVTARNLQPTTFTATNVSVTDTIPSALTYVSSSATHGSYSTSTNKWTIGDLAPGAADTLRIKAEVTGGPGTVTNRAWLDPLTREVENNSGNNQATTNPNLTIS